MISSKDAKKAYTHITDAVKRGGESVMKTFTTLKENCEDINADANDKDLVKTYGQGESSTQALRDMNDKSLTEYRRDHIGYIFQRYNLIPNLTIRENIEVGSYLSKSPLEIDDLIDTLGIKDHQDKLPNQLSGGQQQRCSIGRAVIKNPDILLCDEPTGALDYKNSKEILKLIEKVNQKYVYL